jgi:dihydrofolate synthase/folylpolyglutamate synthase
VLVGGTNGKGSVAAMLESAWRRAGYRTGLYLSPHLISVRERIQTQGRMVPPARFASAVEAVREAARPAGISPSYFETLTAAAFRCFARSGVEIAVVEVGMGGTWDATNVLEPAASALTGVEMDHMKWLGNTRTRIARDKAGIARAGRPFIVGRCGADARRAAFRRAAELGAELFYAPDCCRIEEAPDGWRACIGGTRWTKIPLPLAGEHQRENLRTALTLLWTLRRRFPVDASILRKGLAKVRHRGRLEKVGSRPLVFVDGAHNPSGIAALARFALSRKERPRVFVLAVSRDKDIRGMLQNFRGAADAVVATQTPWPRLLRAPRLASEARRAGFPLVRVEANPLRALEAARRLAGPGGLVCAAGSLYLAGEILKSRMRRPPL